MATVLEVPRVPSVTSGSGLVDARPDPRIAGTLLGFCLTTAGALATAPGVAAVVRERLLPGPTSAALLEWAVAAALLTSMLGRSIAARWARTRAASLVPLVAAASVVAVADRGVSAGVVAVLVVGTPGVIVAPRLAAWLDGRLAIRGRHPLLLAAWVAIVLLLVVQFGRLATYMSDPSSDWWLTTRHELWAKHMCVPAYVQAADLHRQGVQNVYDATSYLGLDRLARPRFTVANLEPFAGDPFQYPPPFLAGAVLALRASNDFLVLRAAWFSVQALAVLLVTWWLARWLSPESTAAFWLLPALLVSVPAMQTLQFGQAHAAIIALAVAGMLAIEEGRDVGGGALLAAAVVSKIFPGLLVLLLVARRRWRALWWTTAFGAIFAGLAWLVLGGNPFRAFLTYQVPRLADGRAFAFLDAWPEWTGWVLADNLSVYGVVRKLRELGVPAMSDALGRLASNLFGLVVVAAAIVASRNRQTRIERAASWLALLTLASLQGLFAWGDYVTFPAVWLLSILPWSVYGTRRMRAFLFAGWTFFALLPGIVPMPVLWPTRITLPLTAAGSVLLVAFGLWATRWRSPAGTDVTASREDGASRHT